MKKLFLIGLFLLGACLPPLGNQSSPPEPTFSPEASATRITPTARPFTVTPSIVPTATATRLSPERYFIEEFDVMPTYWSTLYASGDSERVDVLNQDGLLTFEIYEPITWLYTIYGAFEYERVHFETRVVSRGTEINSMGLVCHYDEQNGWYEFNISNDGAYNLLYGQWLAVGIARYTPIINDTSERIERGSAINEIGLDCYEHIVQLYINGKLIRKMDVSNFGLTGGKIGLSLGSFEKMPVILSFDWVKVSEP